MNTVTYRNATWTILRTFKNASLSNGRDEHMLRRESEGLITIAAAAVRDWQESKCLPVRLSDWVYSRSYL